VTPAQWKVIIGIVTEQMLAFTRPFVTPLTTPTPETIRLTGTGSYVDIECQRLLLTCAHVAGDKPVHYRFAGAEDVFEHQGPWREDPHPIDAATVPMSNAAWTATSHKAGAVPAAAFAARHHTAQLEELLFFRGYAGENAAYGFGVHAANGSGYCSQEVKASGDSEIFEMFWEPLQTQFTAGTSAEAKASMGFNDAQGFSGSLVWNTRYLETTAAGRKWSPDDAKVTGLLRRWDTGTKSLLVWRVEHLRAWLGI
jgi:hypothetical protein